MNTPPARWLKSLAALLATCAGVGFLAPQLHGQAAIVASPPVPQPASRPQDEPSADIAAALAPIIEAHRVPGMVAAIVTGDGAIEVGCAGVRRLGDDQPITIADRMHLGSNTKSMTATLIATLVRDGELTFDTTVSQVFGDLDGSMHPAWKDVTLRLLLTNRSGAPADLDAGGLWNRLARFDGSPSAARMTLVEGVLKAPPQEPPNTRFIYSNAGFAIAGAMAERVTGDAWEALMIERVFEPLGMASAGFGAPGSAKLLDQPHGHSAGGESIEPGPNADNPVAIGPAGIVHCSVVDWATYAAMHLRAGRDADPLGLAPEMYATLHAPASKPAGDDSPDYAMGWGVTRRPWAGDGQVLTHNGSNTMWFATIWLAPDKDFAVLVACNQGGEVAAKACDQAAAAMIARHARRANLSQTKSK